LQSKFDAKRVRAIAQTLPKQVTRFNECEESLEVVEQIEV